MTGPSQKRGFAARPGDAEHWIKSSGAPSARDADTSAFSARLTIDVTLRIARAHQDRSIPARRHGRRHAARPARARISPDRRRPIMTGTAASRVRSGPSPSALASDHLTHVELTWIEKKIEYWIRFGRRRPRADSRSPPAYRLLPAGLHLRVRPLGLQRFRHGHLAHRHRARRLATANPIRRCRSCARAVTSCSSSKAGRRSSTYSSSSTPSRHSASIRRTVSPDHWRHVHNRLTAGHEPRAYTFEQHRAFLKRRRAEP